LHLFPNNKPFLGDSGRITALVRLRYRRHIVFGFSHTFGSFTLLEAHCIWFFAYIWLVYVTGGTLYSVFRIHWLGYVTGGTLYSVFRIHWLGYVTGGTLYSVFRIHLARLRYLRHIVFGFSHTIGSVTLLAAHCIRFFAYNRLGYVTGGTLYSVFRIQSARLRYWRHIVFGFSHTFSSFTLPTAHCIRFFAYICP
jgi:hypothetical protein